MVLTLGDRKLYDFDTLKSICNTFIILDTGSTDNTINVIKNYCNKYNINLYFIDAKNYILIFLE